MSSYILKLVALLCFTATTITVSYTHLTLPTNDQV